MKKHETGDAIYIELEQGDLPSSAYTHQVEVGQAVRGYGSDVVLQIEQAVVEILGEHGRLLSMSKTAYSREYPDHLVYFNACIFDGRALRPRTRRKSKQIWFGDLDLTVDSEKLQSLADRIGPIVVTPETPYRFKGLPKRPRKLESRPGVRVYRPRT